jgi:hypothetical protein
MICFAVQKFKHYLVKGIIVAKATMLIMLDHEVYKVFSIYILKKSLCGLALKQAGTATLCHF